MSLLGAKPETIDVTSSKLGPFSVKTSRRLLTVHLTTDPDGSRAPAGTADVPKATISVLPAALPTESGWWSSLAAELRPLVLPRAARDGGQPTIPMPSLVDAAVAAISQPPYLITPPMLTCDVGCSSAAGTPGAALPRWAEPVL